MELTREHVVNVARSWIGTPYYHQGRVKGITGGVDCLGFLIGVYSELFGNEVEDVPTYTPFWAEETSKETMVEALQAHADSIEVPIIRPLDTAQLLPGDIFVMRMKYNGPAKHCGILSYGNKIIHAYSGHCVSEDPIPPGWQNRIAYLFQFKGIC